MHLLPSEVMPPIVRWASPAPYWSLFGYFANKTHSWKSLSSESLSRIAGYEPGQWGGRHPNLLLAWLRVPNYKPVSTSCSLWVLIFSELWQLLETNSYGLTYISCVRNPCTASGTRLNGSLMWFIVRWNMDVLSLLSLFLSRFHTFWVKLKRLFFNFSRVFLFCQTQSVTNTIKVWLPLLSQTSLCPFVVNCYPHLRKPLCLLSL